MNALLNNVGKYWLESRGRSQSASRYSFSNREIITSGVVMRVSPLWNAIYLNLHPAHYAVAIAPDGKIINLKGGYNYPLLPGRYLLYYIDKQNRIYVIPRISETTLDGAQLSLELVITYRVIDPIKALEMQQPVDTFIRFVQSDLKKLISSHNYDEIVGVIDGHSLDNSLVALFIKEQHAGRHQISKLFYIGDIAIEGMAGDPNLIEIRKNFQVQQRQNIASSELLKQNQELERKVASQEAEIRRIKAQADLAQQENFQKMQLQIIELERARAELNLKQERWSRAMDAITSGLEKAPNPERIDTLANTLLNLLGRKKPEEKITGEVRDESKDKKQKMNKFNISIAYPKLLSKRYESPFLVHIYLSEKRLQVSQNIKSEFGEQEINERVQSSLIVLGRKIKMNFFSPAIDFPEPVIKAIVDGVNGITLLGTPKDNCEPGLHRVLISFLDADTDQEIESLTIKVHVADFAFDHVSRPLLSRVSAVILGIGSFAMFMLAFLEQVDKTVGLTSGTAAGVFALGIYASFYNLYQRVRPNTP